jgi:hypothetical protein
MYINTHYEQDRQFTITGGKKIRRILNLPIIEIAPTMRFGLSSDFTLHTA